MTTDTTSAGMPSIAPNHGALDIPPVQPTDHARPPQGVIRGFADEGKAQVASTLDGLVATVRDVAAKLEGNGAAPFAGLVHQAADTVAGWSSTVNARSVDDLFDDARNAVRTNPALAAGVAVAAGFILTRLIKAASAGTTR